MSAGRVLRGPADRDRSAGAGRRVSGGTREHDADGLGEPAAERLVAAPALTEVLEQSRASGPARAPWPFGAGADRLDESRELG
ncbi:hypothetical protein [Phenylobacterium sp.]|uniref:hypothetical protein n=1 Tax=Phenylobacterium sp. TaxID=1871053 RepID=UPI002BAE8CB4|nr:hypothetical protein [Phenylobacterium sp.]HVI31042.1 hypothetical protein [Phenylobacterium sp.]